MDVREVAELGKSPNHAASVCEHHCPIIVYLDILQLSQKRKKNTRVTTFKNMFFIFDLMFFFHVLTYHAADARLRIVSERVDIIDNLIISVSVIGLLLN